jgi:hypothetical protein
MILEQFYLVNLGLSGRFAEFAAAVHAVGCQKSASSCDLVVFAAPGESGRMDHVRRCRSLRRPDAHPERNCAAASTTCGPRNQLSGSLDYAACCAMVNVVRNRSRAWSGLEEAQASRPTTPG